ncbi:ABC transporter permease [Salinibacterium hongtaonis]|uniref:ABC transporter permease n=1 Tax=Homoserinimonas hongtaonis TaxID=2079791 RepID=UPI000D39495D|nr:ABC transporter permease [Salinibacterium hongtaonis]AWB88983.1 hypothetical protein C2138_05000 [Salinibacterium hongtaonis]
MRLSIAAVCTEALRELRARKVLSIFIVAVVAVMFLTVTLTAGRAAGLRESVVSAVDSTGVKSIFVRANPGTTLSASLLTNISQFSSVENAAAFSPATDVANVNIRGGSQVPLRTVWSPQPGLYGAFGSTAVGATMGTPGALTSIGIPSGIGAVEDAYGNQFTLSGAASLPAAAAALEPTLLKYGGRPDRLDEATVFVINVSSTSEVRATGQLVSDLLSGGGTPTFSIQTNQRLVDLQATLEAEVGVAGQSGVAGALLLAAVIIAAIQTSSILSRRKEFGRRRALGATRSLITALVLTQTLILAVIGATLGGGASTLTLLLLGVPQPPAVFFAALALLSVAVGTLGGVVPAVSASRRDPVTELRIP